MAVDDYVDSNVAVAVAATAAAFSPPVRRVLHRGAVYGVTGVLMLGDVVAAFGRGISRGVRTVSLPPAEEEEPASAKKTKTPAKAKGDEV